MRFKLTGWMASVAQLAVAAVTVLSVFGAAFLAAWLPMSYVAFAVGCVAIVAIRHRCCRASSRKHHIAMTAIVLGIFTMLFPFANNADAGALSTIDWSLVIGGIGAWFSGTVIHDLVLDQPDPDKPYYIQVFE